MKSSMRVCDYIATSLFLHGVRHIYGLMGGGASGLNDGFIKNEGLRYICFHNEQGAGHAAVAESKLTGNISVVNPTTGCGGTNCMTSLLGAWQDSVPVLFISGNVSSNFCTHILNNDRELHVRKYGIQEHDIIKTVKSCTKYAEFIRYPNSIPSALDRAIDIAMSDRKGPVWLDIPADVQIANLDINDAYIQSKDDTFNNKQSYFTSETNIDIMIEHIKQSNKPIILAGQGIKQSKTRGNFLHFVETYKIPVVTTYGAADLLPFNHPLNIGTIGIKGSRAGNFAMQSANLLISLGCSLNNSHIGYDLKTWSPNSVKFIVNIDETDIEKYRGTDFGPFHYIHINLENFFNYIEEIK